MSYRSRRGAARVNIVWLIGLIVGLIVAIVYGFVSNDEAAQEREFRAAAVADRAQALETLAREQDAVRQISRVLGYYDREAAVERANAETAGEGLTTLTNAFSDADPATVKDFQSIVDIVVRSYDARGNEIRQLKSQVDELRAEVSAKDRELRELGNQKDSRIADLERQLRDAEQAANDRQNELSQQIASLQDQVRELEDRRRQVVETAAVAEKTALQEEQQLRTRLREQSKKLSFLKEPEAADGALLAVSKDLAMGWIDLGAEQRVARGMRFRVVDGRPGSERVKATAEVTRVMADTAEVMFLSQSDPYDPPVAGDVIYNPVFDPKGGRFAVLVGRFSGTYNEKELTALLGDMGVTVQPAIDERTDYLILGSEVFVDEDGEPLEEPLQPTDMPEYKEAEARGIGIVPIKDIRAYFKK